MVKLDFGETTYKTKTFGDKLVNLSIIIDGTNVYDIAKNDIMTLCKKTDQELHTHFNRALISTLKKLSEEEGNELKKKIFEKLRSYNV